MVGGADPIPGPRHAGAVSLDLGRMDAVLEVDSSWRAARSRPAPAGRGWRRRSPATG